MKIFYIIHTFSCTNCLYRSPGVKNDRIDDGGNIRGYDDGAGDNNDALHMLI